MQTTTKRDLCEKIARRTDNTHLIVKKRYKCFWMRLSVNLHKVIVLNCVILESLRYASVQPEKLEILRTGAVAFVPAKNVVVFKVGKLMREKVGNPTQTQQPPQGT